MADQINSQHEERESESVIGTGFGRDDFTEWSGNEFVGKRAFGDGLGQNRIGTSNAGGNNESSEKSDFRNGSEHAECCAKPHYCHYGE